MAVNLEKIDDVLINPTTVNLHKNTQVESNIKVKDRTDLASSTDMGQNFIYANSQSLENDPRVGKYKSYVNIRERSAVGNMNSGVQRYVKPLSLKSLAISLGSTSSTSAKDAYKISSSDPFTVTVTPTPNTTNLKCNISLSSSAQYSKYFVITKINDFKFTVTPDYDELIKNKNLPYSIHFIAQDNDNPKIGYTSTGVKVDGYLTIDKSSSSSGGTGSVQYVHIMYSAKSDHSDMAPALTGATWMGTLVDFNITASIDPNDYTWNYIKGDSGSEGQAGKDGVDGKDGEDGLSDPMIQVEVSSNVFPIGPDGWATENKDLNYNVKSYNTNSTVDTIISADGSGNPYANVSWWIDAFTMGKLGLDLWTSLDDEDYDYQDITDSYDPKAITYDDGTLTGKCVDIELGQLRELAPVKEGNLCYSRLGLYIPSLPSGVHLTKIAFLYGYKENNGYGKLWIDVDNYTPGNYMYLSTVGAWLDSDPRRLDSWIHTDMYIRLYFDSYPESTDPDYVPVNIQVTEYMFINLDEVLPSGHTLKEYLLNAIIPVEYMREILDILPWWKGEYEAGVSIPWGIARRMFTNCLELNLESNGNKYIRIDPNYVTSFIYDDTTYTFGLNNELDPPNSDYSNGKLKILTNGKIYLYYEVPNNFNQPWNFSDSDALACNTSDLPYTKYGLNLSGCTGIQGDTQDISRVEEYINLSGCTSIQGNVLDLPQVRTTMNINGCSQINGDASGLWWMENDPILTNSGVTGTYPYQRS